MAFGEALAFQKGGGRGCQYFIYIYMYFKARPKKIFEEALAIQAEGRREAN